MTIDLRADLRRIKSEKHRSPLHPRPLTGLVAAADLAASGGRAALMIDTDVYIRAAAGTLPGAVKRLVESSLLFHCSVCVGELTTGIANANPALPGWTAIRDHYATVLAAIPATRLLTPDPAIWAEAGLIAGTLARTQGYQSHQRKECLNDALIYLTATRDGLPILTTNRIDFDLIQQLAARGSFLHF